MRKGDRKMLANMFSYLIRLVAVLYGENDKNREKEMQFILDEGYALAKEIDAWVEKE